VSQERVDTYLGYVKANGEETTNNMLDSYLDDDNNIDHQKLKSLPLAKRLLTLELLNGRRIVVGRKYFS
jgi:hypothetical protein